MLVSRGRTGRKALLWFLPYPPMCFFIYSTSAFENPVFCCIAWGAGQGRERCGKQNMLFSSAPPTHTHTLASTYIEPRLLGPRCKSKGSRERRNKRETLDLRVGPSFWGAMALTCRVRRCIVRNILEESALSGRFFSRGRFFFIMANCSFISGQGMFFPPSDKRLKGTETVRQSTAALPSLCR